MKFIGCILLILVTALPSAFAATSIGFFNNPAHPGKCAIEEYLILSPGDKIKDPNHPCARIVCQQGGIAAFHTCSPHYVKGCKTGGYIDTCAPYPECCERHIICD